MKRILKFGMLSISLLFLSGCDNANRSMVFFTGTTLGIEIAFEPNLAAPAKFIIGYKRAEGLMDPVMEDATAPGKYKIKYPAHSVLAKIAGEVNAGSGSASPSLQGAQWFASGKAAEILAQNPLMAATLVNDTSASSSIANAVVALSLREIEAGGLLSTRAILRSAFGTLKEAAVKKSLTADQRASANELLAQLNASSLIAAVPASERRYDYDFTNHILSWKIPTWTQPPVEQRFEILFEYLGLLSRSRDHLKHASDDIGLGISITDNTGTLSAANKSDIESKISELERTIQNYVSRAYGDKAVIDMLRAIVQ